VLTLGYTGDAPTGDRISMVWSTFVLYRLISSAPRTNLFRISLWINVDVIFLVITDVPWLKVVLMTASDVCLCIKCIVLWRYASHPPQPEFTNQCCEYHNSGEELDQTSLIGPSGEELDQTSLIGPDSIPSQQLPETETLEFQSLPGLITERVTPQECPNENPK
jgi:hypothetical protein